MSKKLYIVRIERSAYVLAESEDEALRLRSDIEEWEEPEVSAEPWRGEALGWDDDSLVYCEGTQDMTFGEAKALPR